LFQPGERAIIEAGEKAGDVAPALDYLAQSIRVRGMRNYPALLVTIEALYIPAVVSFILVFIVPKFKTIYDQLGAELPGLTQLLVDATYVLSHDAIWFTMALVIAALFVRGVRRRSSMATLCLRVFPPLRETYWCLALSRFSYTLGSLLRAGVPQIEALDLAVRASRNPIMISRGPALRGDIENGQRLDEALARVPLIPPRFVWYVRQGVMSEQPEQTLLAISEGYLSDHRRRMYVLGSWLFPITMAALGVIVLFTVVALYLPLFNIPKIVGRD
jgi:type II secretory pathway component PulF